MNDLHNYYRILGLEPGATLEEVIDSHKFMSQALHPDFFQFPKKKKQAEEKTKKINDARDRLRAHLTSSEHRKSGACACRLAAGGDFKAKSAPRNNTHEEKGDRNKKQKEAEESARRRADERRREQEADAKQQAEEQEAREKEQAQLAKQQELQLAFEKQLKADSERRRWNIFQVEVAALFFLCLLTWSANSTLSNTAGYEPESTPEMLEQSQEIAKLRAQNNARKNKLVALKRQETKRLTGDEDYATELPSIPVSDAPQVPITSLDRYKGPLRDHNDLPLTPETLRRRLLEQEWESREKSLRTQLEDASNRCISIYEQLRQARFNANLDPSIDLRRIEEEYLQAEKEKTSIQEQLLTQKPLPWVPGR